MVSCKLPNKDCWNVVSLAAVEGASFAINRRNRLIELRSDRKSSSGV
jgi:hypothetical protein